MSKPSQDKSYSAVMNEWAAQRSFINQMRSRVWHPPYDAPWYGKIWGYLWRLGVVVGAFLLISYVALKTRMRSTAFRGHLAEEVAKRYKATNVTCGATVASYWNDECTIKALGADGAEGSFFNRLDAYQVNFSLGSQFLRTDWHIDKLFINQLSLNLRSGTLGGMDAAPTTPQAKPDRVVVPQLRTSDTRLPVRDNAVKLAGFGLSPKFSELTIRAYDVKELNLRWGYTEATAGKLEGANATLEPTKSNGWAFEATCGELTQNWLAGMKIRRLEVTVEDALVFQRASLTKGTSEVEMSGSMSLGELPQLDLRFQAKALDLKAFTPEAYSNYFDAEADVIGKITGTINRSSGVKTQFKVKLVPPTKAVATRGGVPVAAPTGVNVAWLKNIRFFRSLYMATGEDSLSQPVVTRGAFNLETSEGVMRITELDLECGDQIRIRGELTCIEKNEPAKLADGLQGSPSLGYKLDTNLLVGLKSDLVNGMPSNIQKKYFTREGEGMRWMPLQLSGEDGKTLTHALAEEMSELQKEALLIK